MKNQVFNKWMYLALIYFILAALLGVAMRLPAIHSSSFINYKHLLHTHSHIAMLGWTYTALYIGLINAFLKPTEHKKYYKRFLLTQFTIFELINNHYNY